MRFSKGVHKSVQALAFAGLVASGAHNPNVAYAQTAQSVDVPVLPISTDMPRIPNVVKNEISNSLREEAGIEFSDCKLQRVDSGPLSTDEESESESDTPINELLNTNGSADGGTVSERVHREDSKDYRTVHPTEHPVRKEGGGWTYYIIGGVVIVIVAYVVYTYVWPGAMNILKIGRDTPTIARDLYDTVARQTSGNSWYSMDRISKAFLNETATTRSNIESMDRISKAIFAGTLTAAQATALLMVAADCLVGNTIVTLVENGKRVYKKISDVKPGETAYAWDIEAKKFSTSEIKRVKKNVSRNVYRIHIEDKDKPFVDCTGDHPFWVSAGKSKKAKRFWARIEDSRAKLEKGVYLVTKKQKRKLVTKIERLRGKHEVYDLIFSKPTIFYCNQFATSTCSQVKDEGNTI